MVLYQIVVHSWYGLVLVCTVVYYGLVSYLVVPILSVAGDIEM